jgi:P4 family phage/plasmid primase-like protien
MNIIAYLDKENIRWQPVTLRLGTKAPSVVISGEHTWQPKTNDFYGATRVSDDDLRYRQTHYPTTYEHVVIDTSVIQQIDVDAPDAIPGLDDVIDSMGPWFRSCTKGLPHVFVRLENSAKYGKRDVSVISDKIDILNGLWSIASVDATVFGHDTAIKPLHENFLRSYKPTASTTSIADLFQTHPCDDTRQPHVDEDQPIHDHGMDDDGDEIVDDVDRLLGMLSPRRVDAYSSWIDVGIALRSIGGNVYLDKWIHWSRQSAKFDMDMCVTKWATFTRSDVTLGSLRFWAKQDDAIGFKQFIEDNVARIVANMKNFEDYNIASSIVYNMFRDTYVATPVSGGRFEWYEFRGHGYHSLNHTPHTLLISFSEAVSDVFHDERLRCEEAGSCASSEEDKKYFSDRASQCLKVAKRMCTNSAKTAILRECCLLFRRGDFIEKLNEFTHLIGFENGVYDLSTMSFRDGKPEDYITYSTRYSYVTQVDEEIRADIMRFKRSIMPNDRMMDYLIITEAYALDGDMWIQNINIQTGYGGNGKGINSVLVTETFGDYFYAPDISLFTKAKSSSSGTSSELAKAKGKRFLLSTEPEAHERLQVSKLKYMTGGDKVQSRALYEAPIEFTPQFAITLQMNQIPRLSNHDGGIARRLKFIPFIFNFVPLPKTPNEKKLDVTLRKRFETRAYAQQYMLILLEYYEKYLRGHRTIVYPPEVQSFTDQYMEEENVVQMFVKVCCQITHDQKDRVQSSVLYNNFKHSEYYREEVTNIAFARKMQETGVQKKKSKGTMTWVGIKFIQPDIEFIG